MPRNPRYGANLFEVRVLPSIDPQGVLYFYADSVTITPGGALILAAEVAPLEHAEDGHAAGIELPPALVVAPGLWQCVIQVTEAVEGHRPWFSEGGAVDTPDDEDEDDEDEDDEDEDDEDEEEDE
jgi:hypothetical protein